MNFDRRSLAAIIFCMVFYFAYSQYLSTKYPNQGKQQSAPTVGQSSVPAAQVPVTGAPEPGSLPPADIQKLSDADLMIETDTTIYRFDQETGGLASIILKNYTQDAPKAGQDVSPPPVDLIGGGGLGLQAVDNLSTTTLARNAFHAERQGRVIKFWRDAGGFRVGQEYRVAESGYGMEIVLNYTNISDRPLDLTAGYLVQESFQYRKAGSLLGFIPGTITERDQLIYSIDGSVELENIESACGESGDVVNASNAAVHYLGFDKHYFLTALLPKARSTSFRVMHSNATEAGCVVSVLGYEPQGAVQAGETAQIAMGAYFGPKDLDVLKTVDPRLESSMNFGVFEFIARPLLLIIKGFYNFAKNYGVAIVLLTLLLKILFYPLTKASAVSMHKMKKLNPQMTAIKEKYAKDRQRQQQELMKFMAQNKINPMKGCLPILPQIPVFFAFYQVLQYSIELRHAPFFGWIQDLSAPDPFLVTPLLMGVAMFVQQKLTPTSGMDKTQEKILLFMPIIFTVMMLSLPAGLTLYMLTNTVVGILQQKWLYRKLDQLGA